LFHVADDENFAQGPAAGLLGFDEAADDLHVFLAEVLRLGKRRRGGREGGREGTRVG
jgi:hypothetical protein